MKPLEVKAQTSEKAIEIGSRRLDLRPDEVSATLVNRLGDGMGIWRVAQRDAGSIGADPFDRLEQELENIENEKTIRGMHDEALEEKGLLGAGPLTIKRSEHAPVKGKTGYDIAEGIDVHIHAGLCAIADIEDELLDGILETPADVEIAKRTVSKQNTWPPPEAPADYGTICNIKIRMDGNELRLISSVKGKVVLLRKCLYVVPSDRDGSCSVTVDDDRMAAWCDIKPPRGEGKAIGWNEIQKALADAGVVSGIRVVELKNAAEFAMESDSYQKQILAAKGTAPIHGRDAEARFTFNKSQDDESITVLPDGRIDYRKKANILLVEKGELLATLGHPIPGVMGKDVTGKDIPCEPGSRATVVCGENVVADANGDNFYASEAGQAQLNGNILNVFQHLFIATDVDFRCGNINFTGNLTINGSILPGFEVVASGDIIVMGDIDSANVKAGRDLSVMRGVIGGPGTLVQCGRNFSAGHLQNACVEAEGDVSVKNSCMHSFVGCTGSFSMAERKGSVIGGEISALGSITVKSAGSPTGTKTALTAGEDFLVKKKTKELNDARSFFSESIEKIDLYLKPVNDMVRDGQKLDPVQKQRLHAVFTKKKDLTKNIRVLDARLRTLSAMCVSNENTFIRITGELYPDTKLSIRDQVLLIATLQQHVRYTLDLKSGTLVHSAA